MVHLLVVVEYVCRDLKEKDCGSDKVYSEAARFSGYVGLVTSIPMFLASGTFGVLSDRLGRRFLIILSSLAPIIPLISWLLISLESIKFINRNWTAFVYGSVLLSAISGGGFVGIMAIFAYVADLTARKPDIRARMFVIIEGVFAGVGVLGLIYSGQMQRVSIPWTFASLVIMCAIQVLLAYSLKESTPEEVRKRPIRWEQANTFAALLFALPISSTRKVLEEDFEKTKRQLRRRRDICIEAGTLEVPAGHLIEINQGNDKNDLRPIPSSPWIEAKSPMVDATPMIPIVEGRETTENYITARDVSPNGPMPERLRAILEQSEEAYESHFKEVGPVPDSFKSKKSSNATLHELVTMPAPRNTIPVVMMALTLSLFVLVGKRTIITLFFKKAFNLKGEKLSYALAADGFAKCLGPLVVIPLLIKPRVKTRLGELRVSQLFLILNGCLVVLMVVVKQLWYALLCGCAAGLVYMTPMGLMRHILSSEVGAGLQGRMLSTIAAVEACFAIFSSFLFSMLYSNTTRYPIISFGLMGFLLIVCALILQFRNDEKRIFNLRGLVNKKLPAELEAEERIKAWREREGAVDVDSLSHLTLSNWDDPLAKKVLEPADDSQPIGSFRDVAPEVSSFALETSYGGINTATETTVTYEDVDTEDESDAKVKLDRVDLNTSLLDDALPSDL